MTGFVRAGHAESFVRVATAWACCAVFAFAGFSKLHDPKPTSEFLAAMFALRDARVVTGLGIAELLLALALAHIPTRRTALAISMCLFAAFAVLHAFRATDGAAATRCGCLGAGGLTDNWPPAAWIALNAGLSLLACLGASEWRWSRAPRAPDHRPANTPSQESLP